MNRTEGVICGGLLVVLVAGMGCTQGRPLVSASAAEDEPRTEAPFVQRSWAKRSTWTSTGAVGFWGLDADDLYAVTSDQRAIHWDGTTWTELPQFTIPEDHPWRAKGYWHDPASSPIDPPDPVFTALWGAPRAVATSVRETPPPSPLPETERGRRTEVGVAPDGEVLFASRKGMIARWRDGTWDLDEPSRPFDLFGIWGSASGELVAVGQKGTIVRWDGERWSPQPSGTEATLHDVWGVGPDDIFAVGDGGAVVRWDGVRWSTVPAGTPEDLLAVWGSGPDDIFAAGRGGTMIHWDGREWSPQPNGTEATLLDIGGCGPGDALAVGEAGLLLLWNGTRWVQQSLETEEDLTAVWCVDPAHVVLSSDRGVVFHSWEVGEEAPEGTERSLARLLGPRRGPLLEEGRESRSLLIYDEERAPPPELAGAVVEHRDGRIVARGAEVWWTRTSREGGTWRHCWIAPSWPDPPLAGRIVPVIALADQREFDDVTLVSPWVYLVDGHADLALGPTETPDSLDLWVFPVVSRAPEPEAAPFLRYARLCPETRFSECLFRDRPETLRTMDDPPLPPGGWVVRPDRLDGAEVPPPPGDPLATIVAPSGEAALFRLIGEPPPNWEPGWRLPEPLRVGVWLRIGEREIFLASYEVTVLPFFFDNPYHGLRVFRSRGHLYVWIYYQETTMMMRELTARRLESQRPPRGGRLWPVDPQDPCNRTVCSALICPVELAPGRLGVALFNEDSGILFEDLGPSEELVPGEVLPICGRDSGSEHEWLQPPCEGLVRLGRDRSGARCLDPNISD